MSCKECNKPLNLSEHFMTLFTICDYCGKINETRKRGEKNGK